MVDFSVNLTGAWDNFEIVKKTKFTKHVCVGRATGNFPVHLSPPGRLYISLLVGLGLNADITMSLLFVTVVKLYSSQDTLTIENAFFILLKQT